MRDDDTALTRLIRHVSVITVHPGTGWATRLWLYRLAFAAVLVAPKYAGGAALTRGEALALAPAGLQSLRSVIGEAEEPADCPRCKTARWVEALVANDGWSGIPVRHLAKQPEDPAAHRHLDDDGGGRTGPRTHGCSPGSTAGAT